MELRLLARQLEFLTNAQTWMVVSWMAEHGPVTAKDLEKDLEVSAQNIRQIFCYFRKYGLASCVASGNLRIYSLNVDGFEVLINFINQLNKLACTKSLEN